MKQMPRAERAGILKHGVKSVGVRGRYFSRKALEEHVLVKFVHPADEEVTPQTKTLKF